MSKKKKIIIGAIVLVVIGAMVFVNLKKSRGKTIEVTSEEVKQGDTILVLDTRDIQAELASMRDELALRRNNVEKLKLNWKRALLT